MLTLKTFLEHFKSSTLPDGTMQNFNFKLLHLERELNLEKETKDKTTFYYQLHWGTDVVLTGNPWTKPVAPYTRKTDICREYISYNTKGEEHHVIHIRMAVPTGWTYVPVLQYKFAPMNLFRWNRDVRDDIYFAKYDHDDEWYMLDLFESLDEPQITPNYTLRNDPLYTLRPTRKVLSSVSIVHQTNSSGDWSYMGIYPGEWQAIDVNDWTGLRFCDNCWSGLRKSYEVISLAEFHRRRFTRFAGMEK